MQTLNRLLAASIAFTATSLPFTAQAQQETVAVVEEIIVTANRRQEMLQDVPLSIAAFNDSFFQDAGVTDFKTLENYAASLKITPGTSSRETSIRIRGIGSTGANSGIDPSVGVFIDNVYQGRAGMSLSDFIDIERVEVLRGPQGTLYGKNTAAGAISVITKAPTSEFEATVEAILGNYNNQELRGMVNVPINKTGSAIRVSAYNVDRGGYDRNTFLNKDVNDSDKSGIKFKTLLQLDDLGSLTLTIDKSRDDSNCCAPDIITYDGSSNLNLTFAQLAEFQVGGDGVLPEADPFDRKIEADANYQNSVDVGGISLEWSKYLDSDYVLTWTNAYRSYDSQSEFDADFSRYNAGLGSTDVDYSQKSSEFRIASPEGETIDWQLGIYYFESNMDTIQTLTMETDAAEAARESGNIISGTYDFGPTPDALMAAGVFGTALQPIGTLTGVQTLPPTGPPFFNSDMSLDNIVATDTNNHKTLNYAVFGQAMWNVDDNLTATLGLRYTFEEKKRSGTQITTPTQGNLCVTPPVPGRESGPFGPDLCLDEERDVENVSPSINVRYYPDDSRLMYYGSISKGFKSGGFNQQRTGSNSPTEFDDESSTNFELGWKGTFLDGGLQFNGAVYFIDYKDFQSQSFDGTDIAVRNAGTMESYGLELELQYVPTINLQMGGSLGYNKAEYKEFDNAECTVADARAQFIADVDAIDAALEAGGLPGGLTPHRILATQLAPAAFGLDAPVPTAPQGCSQDLEGQQVDNAPEWTASTFLQYEDVLSEEAKIMWFGRLEYIYTDSFFLAQDLDENIENDETSLVNVRAGIKSMDQTWEVAIWGRNMTDEEYYTAGLDVPVYSGYVGFTAPPRTYGASLRYNF